MARHSDSEQEEYSDQYDESEQEYSDNDPMSEDDHDEESDEVLYTYPPDHHDQRSHSNHCRKKAKTSNLIENIWKSSSEVSMIWIIFDVHFSLTRKLGLAHVSFEQLAEVQDKMGMKEFSKARAGGVDKTESTKNVRSVSKAQILEDVKGAVSKLDKGARIRRTKNDMKRANKHRYA